jgi:hypothetical protein
MPFNPDGGEARRARRIRDRHRMLFRAYNHFKCEGTEPFLCTDPEPTFRWIDNQGRHHIGIEDWDAVRENRMVHAVRAADNGALCSHYCCGNPRRWFGKRTMQEIRDSGRSSNEIGEEGIGTPTVRHSGRWTTGKV